jgi:protein transport protein SEC24
VAPESTESAIEMLHAYRRHCASNSSPGQLILPESLKLLPLYLAVAGKLAAFTVNKPPSNKSGYGPGGAMAEVSVRADSRVVELATLSSIPASRLVPFMYPRMYRIDLLAPQHGVSLPLLADGAAEDPAAPPPAPQPAHTLTHEQLLRVALPPSVYPSIEQVAQHATYLLEHRTGLYLIIGSDSDEDTFRDLFGSGVPGPAALPPGTPLPLLDSEASMRLWSMMAAIRSRRPPFLPVVVVAPSDTPLRELVATYMAEDRVGSARSYVDLLCHVHTAIQTKLQQG